MSKVFLDKISATAHIESVVGTTDFSNGQFLELGVLESDGESRAVKPANSEETAEVLLAHAPIDYGYPDFDLAKWKLEAGKIGRAYHLQKGDVIEVTTDLVADADKVTVGANLTIGENGLGFKAAAADARGIARLISKESQGLMAMFA
ncbi:hypothetical protein [Liquorilactobacillus hordei]|uniref:hypothetical protein n=1 Tax=Liquorilactobacillus hordei TaxID=468911 RepID=UPI00215A05D6|nr:hypothetical protein [Liquorilactobacillus hordei]